VGFFRFPGRRRDFRDGGDGEADRPAGPRRARDSRPVADRGVGKARMGAGLGAVPAGFAARASGREGSTAARVWRVNELGWTVLKTRVIYLVIY
jgi:hypothetical protein